MNEDENAPSSDSPPPMKTPGPTIREWLTHSPGRYFFLVTVIVIFTAPAFALPTWWATVPTVSILGFVAWKQRYWLSGVLGGLVGFAFWLVELELYPRTPTLRLATALAGAEGLSPTALFLVGPILFGLVTALGALTLAGGLRLFVPLSETKREEPMETPTAVAQVN